MLPIVVAAVVGFGVGALRSPHGRHIALPRFNARFLALAGIALQVALVPASGAAQGRILGASLACFGLFALWNRHLVGMGTIAIGLASNVTVILANGAMPVRPSALIASGATSAGGLATTDLGAGRRFERSDDTMSWLGDIVPVEVFSAAMSFGDLIIVVGVAVLAGELARYARRGSRWQVIPGS